MSLPSLEIILRTCTRKNVTTGQWQRIVPFEKKEIVLGCTWSLFKSINAAKSVADFKVTLIDDGSDEYSLELISSWAHMFQFKLEMDLLGGVGFNQSALRQFEKAAKSQADWVYSVEDDYLHCTEAVAAFIKDSALFKTRLDQNPIAIHPFDDPFTYWHTDKMSSSKLVLGCNRHWRTNTFSTNTLFAEPRVFLDNFSVFEKLAKEYGITTTNEHTTINLLWNNGVDRSGPVYLFTPIPSLALHLSYNNAPPFMDWKNWWDDFANYKDKK
jgi:hypothetical protein